MSAAGMTKEELLKVAKPMLFNTEMVKAIMDGRKTQTRRVTSSTANLVYKYSLSTPSSRYQIGDILYIRETWQHYNYIEPCDFDIIYKASPHEFHWDINTITWKPSIHMPKKYARTFLKVIDIRVERLQDISDEDCMAEGIENLTNYDAYELRDRFDTFRVGNIHSNTTKASFAYLWNKTALKGYKWEDNPYVFVYEFEKIEVSV